MPAEHERDIEERMLDDALIDGALADAVRDALIQHKRAGNPIAVWEDGRVVWIPADEINVDMPPPANGDRQELGRTRTIPETGDLSHVLLPAGNTWPNDEKLIIAHEQLPWSYVRRTVWPERGFAVLFGDGTVRILTVDDMGAAIVRDRYQRKELGWPVPP